MLSDVNMGLGGLFRLVVFVRELARFLAAQDSDDGFGFLKAALALEADRVHRDAALGVDLDFYFFSGHACSNAEVSRYASRRG